MTPSYPHSTLWINGRFVGIDRILSGEELHLTPFEANTFSFVRDWLSGTHEFEIFTSGSTGEPKKLLITRSQMFASASLTAEALSLKSSDVCLVCIDTKYIGGRMMLVRALTLGMKILAADPASHPLSNLPAGQCVDFAAFVPYQIEHMLEVSGYQVFNNVTKAIIGGAKLNESTILELRKSACMFWATYGMTETISHVALRQLNGAGMQDYFETLPGISVSVDTRNCMVLSVPFLQDKIVTNDLGELLTPSRFQWVGRYDNIINTGGVKVSPEKIENSIAAFFARSGYKNRFFVHGLADRKLGQRVVLVIEANIIDEEFLSSLSSFMKATLSLYEIPKGALLASKFSETANGKINRLQTVKAVHANVSFK